MNNIVNHYKKKNLEYEETLKKVEREMFLKESTFQKEKALLEHKTMHFEK